MKSIIVSLFISMPISTISYAKTPIKENKCYTDTDVDVERWETSKAGFFLITEIGKRKYLVNMYVVGSLGVVFMHRNTIPHYWLEYSAEEISCPFFLYDWK